MSVTGGAYNWWHVNNGGPLASGYGIPGVLPGTHSYYLFVDKEEPVDWGEITKIGAHVQTRFRDSGVPLRPFYVNDDFWLWEAYGFLDTPLGRLKAGSIYRQFGLFWDDSWWGNVQYMDGLKLRSDYGVSLEDTPDFKDDFKIDRYFQFFFAQSRVSGAILGADSDSFAGSEMRNTFIARVVPTWKLGEKQTFAVGVSATVGSIDNQPTLTEYGTNQVFASPGDQTVAGWAVDGTWTAGPLEALRRGLSTLWHAHSQRLHFRRPKQSLYRWTRGDHLHARPYDLSLRLLVWQSTTTPTDARACSSRESRPRSLARFYPALSSGLSREE